MRPKLTELEMMKFWLDSEFTIVHVLIAGLALFFVHPTWVRVLIIVYMVYSSLYAIVRMAAVLQQDRNYLKLPQIDPDIVPRRDGR